MLWLFAILATVVAVGRAKENAPDALGSGLPLLEQVETLEVETYTILIGQDDEGTWDWRAWLTTVFESGDELDGREEGMGFDAASRDEAVLDAQQWVMAQLAGPLGEDAPSQPPALTRRGVRVSGDCSSVSVSDIDQWIGHAAPIVAAYDVEDPQAEQVMRLTLAAAFPECGFDQGTSPEIRGQSWETSVQRVQGVIDKIVAGELLSVAPLEDVVAARVVGMSAPAVPGSQATWHTGANNGNVHAIVVRPRPAALGGHEYFVWKGPRRKWSEAAHNGIAGNRSDAMKAAKQWADEYFEMGVSTS